MIFSFSFLVLFVPFIFFNLFWDVYVYDRGVLKSTWEDKLA